MSDLRLTTESELGAGVMPAPYLLPDTNVSRRIDRTVAAIGKAFSWLWVALIVVITLNVVLRYVFRSGFVALEEMQWHIYSVGFLLGLSYCITMDGHVRIDVMAEHLRRARAPGSNSSESSCCCCRLRSSSSLRPFRLFCAHTTSERFRDRRAGCLDAGF
jgi:hypothetical protein